MNIAEKIIDLKERLQESKEQQLIIKSKTDALLERLKKEFNCTTVEEAETKLSSLEKELQSTQTQLEKSIIKFEEAYPFD